MRELNRQPCYVRNECTVRATESVLQVGARVFQRNHPKGGNKVQGFWNPKPYVIVDKKTNNVLDDTAAINIQGNTEAVPMQEDRREADLNADDINDRRAGSPAQLEEDQRGDPVRAEHSIQCRMPQPSPPSKICLESRD